MERGEMFIKTPIIDQGKRSKRGRLALSSDFETVRERENLLEVVFRDRKLFKDYSFDEIRNKERK